MFNWVLNTPLELELFLQKASSYMFNWVLNTPLELVTIFAKGFIMFDWALDTPLTCLKKENNCEMPVTESFLEMLRANTKK